MTTTVPESSAAAPHVEPSFEVLAQRVDDAVRALESLDPAARSVADELKDAIESVHRAGLVTIVRRMREHDAAREVLFELVDDPVVRLLLSLHEIIRPDPMTHANNVLREVRPALQGHGGDVSLVRVEDGTAFVRLQGACNGCSMASVTLRNLVEEALVSGVPSISRVEVVPNEPSETLIPVDSLFTNSRAEEGWVSAGRADAVAKGQIAAIVLTADGVDTDVLVVNAGHRPTAYRNECAHEALPLDNAILDLHNGTLTCPWHGFCYDAASGECLSAPGAQLEQLPLRVDGDQLWIRVGP